MLTRRTLALASFGALLPSAAWAVLPTHAGDQEPRLIDGTPPHLDFGHGLLVPATNAALNTLWEGDDRYLTFGRSSAVHGIRAAARAELAASGTMRFMLLTKAFAPARLTRFDACGWRSASGSVRDLVLGELKLPGRPYQPGLVWGNTTGLGFDGQPGIDATQQALCLYMVRKTDVGLDYIRQNALLVCTGGDGPEAGLDPAMAAREVCPPEGTRLR